MLVIINIYRILKTSSNGVYYLLTQYNKVDRKAKTVAEYRKEILNQIKQYLNENTSINDVIIVGDYNQSIVSKEIEKFHKEIGVIDIHHKHNNIPKDKLDKTYINRSILINAIVATNRILEYIEGYKLLGYNEIVCSDYRVYIVDIVLEEYFRTVK